MTEKASQLLAQVGPHGQLLPKTCPFGVHTLPAYFQYLMSQNVLHGIEGDGVESFLDDCNVHAPGETDEEAFEREFELLEECFRLDFKERECGGPNPPGTQIPKGI